MSDKVIVMRESDEAARLETRAVWVCRNNHSHDDERSARYCGSTHTTCSSCGSVVEKCWLKCAACRAADDLRKYEAMPRVPYTGDPVYSEALDRYLMDEDEIEYALDDMDEGTTIADLRLVECYPNMAANYAPTSELFADGLDPDAEGSLPNDVEEALDAFRVALEACASPLSWSSGKKAIDPATVHVEATR
jgi:hypothetical protein